MNTQSILEEWYKKPFGQFINMQEQIEMATVLAKLPASCLLQLGLTGPNNGIDEKLRLHKIIVNSSPLTGSLGANITQLPFSNDSVDIILVPHTLETESTSAAEILTEAWRVLAPGGHLLILGFNPWSISKLLNHFSQPPLLPSLTHQYSLQKIRTLLQNHQAEITLIKTFCYLSSVDAQTKFAWLDTLGQLLLPSGGLTYIVLAKKQLASVTPLRANWSWDTLLTPKNVGEPSIGRVRRG